MKKLLCIVLVLAAALAWGQGSQFDFLLNQQRNSSASLAGGTATFYSAGTDNLKAIYTNIGMTVAAANPYTLNASGKAQVYGSGLYKIVVKNSAGVVQYTYDNVAVNSLGGFGASQTPTAGEIPILGSSREFKIKDGGGVSRNIIRDKGATGVIFGSMDHARTWVQGSSGVTLGAGYDPYGTPLTQSSDSTLSPSGNIVTRVSSNSGASFTNYTTWTVTKGANNSAKLNGFQQYTSAGASRIPLSGSNGRLATGWMPSGTVLQTVFTNMTAVTAMSASIPADNTIPQKTEGDEVLSTTFTPQMVGSSLVFSSTCPVGYAARVNGFGIVLALFRDSIADAFAASIYEDGVSSNTIANAQPTIQTQTISDSLVARTYQMRIGVVTGGASGYINGLSGNNHVFGGVMSPCHLRIDEIAP